MSTLEASYTKQERTRIEHIALKDQWLLTKDDIDFVQEVKLREEVHAYKVHMLVQACGFPNCSFGAMQ